MGARELREGISGTPTATAPADVLARLTVSQLLDAMAVRLDGPRAADHHLRIDWKLGELLGLLDDPDPGFAIVTPS